MKRDILDILRELSENRVLLCAVTSWFTAQFLKYLIDGFRHRGWRIRLFFSSGGMPSSHTSSMAALCMGTGFSEGFGSALFAFSFVMAMIVMYDAAGVRQETGKQGIAINSLIDWLSTWNEDPPLEDANMKERVGHHPREVFAGALLGFLWSLIFFAL